MTFIGVFKTICDVYIEWNILFYYNVKPILYDKPLFISESLLVTSFIFSLNFMRRHVTRQSFRLFENVIHVVHVMNRFV